MAFIADTRPEEGGLGWVFRPQPQADVGIDGHLEVIKQETNEATGRFVGVQAKAGASQFDEPVRDGWIIRVRRPTVEYWRAYAVPVLLVIVDLVDRVGYWTRVDDTDFPSAGDDYKILVPKGQRFDVSSVAQISAIAENAPPSLLSQIEFPGSLAADEPIVRQALKNATTPEELIRAAERAIEFAGALRSAGRPYDAAFMWREGAKSYLKSDEPERGLRALTDLVGWLVHDVRDPEFALTIHRYAFPSDSPLRKGATGALGAEGGAALSLEIVVAGAEAACGKGHGARALSARLLSMSAETLNRWGIEPVGAAARLRVAAALADADHEAASRAYADLAAASSGDESAGAMLRASLHAGLAGRAAAELDRIEAIPAGGVPSVERALVLGWLRAFTGDVIAARLAFLAAADAALASDDPTRALRALRNAERAEKKGSLLPVGLDSVSRRARRLEGIAAQRAGDRVTPSRFVERIDARLARGDAREAYFAVQAADVYAWTDIDWAAEEDAQVRFAAVMRAAAVEVPSLELIAEAIRATMTADVLLEDRQADSALKPFLAMLSERLTPEFGASVWDAIDESVDGGDQIMGALALATPLADGWTFPDRDARIGSLVRRALAMAGPVDRDGPVTRAIEFIMALSPPLQGSEAGAVRDALVPFLDTIPPGRMADLLNAIAVTTAEALPPADGGRDLFVLLTIQENRAAKDSATPQWLGALAMLHRQASSEVKEDVARILTERALAPKGRSVWAWDAAERAIAGGIEMPVEVADRYLTAMADLLDRLRAQTPKTGLGVGASDVHPLTTWAATKATPVARERALRAAIAFLQYSKHLLHERIRWIPLIALLGRWTPELVPEAVEALLLAAKGKLMPRGDLDAFTHPFDTFKVVGHSLAAVRSQGVQWLAMLIPAADQGCQQRIIDVLQGAATASEPDVRRAAAMGAGWVINQSGQVSTAGTRLRDLVLLPLTRDRVPGVALIACRALTAGFE